MHTNPFTAMKNNTYLLLILACLTAFVAPGFSQNQNGLQWFRQYHSDGICSTPGFVYANQQAVIALNFTDTLFFETGSVIEKRFAKAMGDVMLLKSEMQTGTLTASRQLTAKEYMVVTSITFVDGMIKLAGACRDSVFLVSDSNNLSYLGGHSGKEKGFIISVPFSLDTAHFDYIASNMDESGIDLLKFDGNSGTIATGTARPDSVSEPANFVLVDLNGNTLPLLLDTLSGATISDAAFFNGVPWVGGAFADSLVLLDTILTSNSGTQAFIAKIEAGITPYAEARVWRCYQKARVAGMATMGPTLWVAINFTDSLMLPNGLQILGKGMSDGVVMQYDTAMNLLNFFQFGGTYSERIDKIFKQGNRLYILANTGSPDTRIWKNGVEANVVTSADNNGVQTLFSIDTDTNSFVEWTATEGRLGKIRGTFKADASETLLSGSFMRPLTIDSMVFNPRGHQDVYLMRIADACINMLKKSNIVIPLCQGDSLTIAGAYLLNGNTVIMDTDSGLLTLKEPGKFGIRQYETCECRGGDILEIVATNAQRIGRDEAGNLKSVHSVLLDDGSRVDLRYCGDCGISQEAATFQVRPVPASHEAWLDAWLPDPATLSVKVVNSEGAVISQTQMKLTAGTHILPLNAQQWPSGTYWLHLTHNNGKTAFSRIFAIVKL